MVNIHSQHLTFKVDTTIDTSFMVVVIVGKKVLKKVVDRNLLKRRLREIFRDSPIKGVVYTKKGAGNLDYNQLKEESKKIKDKLN